MRPSSSSATRPSPPISTSAPSSGPAGDPETDRYRLFEAVVTLLGAIAASAPLLLVLDDLHWADRPTLQLLRHLIRSPQSARVKILGAVELSRSRFHYRRDAVFNAETYLDFLQQLAPHYRRRGAILIQDNASYHKDARVWGWFKSNRHWLEVHQLPPYSPEFNPTERMWQHTRKNGTHNRFFATETELMATLSRVFGDMQAHPETIRPYLVPFF